MGAPLPRPLTAPERQTREHTQARRQSRYETVRELRNAGKTIREIATELPMGPNMGPNTIQRLVRAASCPVPAQRQRRTTLLSPFEPYLRERWNGGEQNGQCLLREIREHGYGGSQTTLSGLLGRWRLGPRHRGPYARQSTPAPPILPSLRTSPREVSWLFLRPADDLEALEDAYLTELVRSTPTIATTWESVRSFFALVRERQPEQLDAWLTQARMSGVRELAAFAEGIRRRHSPKAFAEGIRRDYAAVRAACELPWSQGQTEGHVNRLKLLKRQMFGRAKLDLLRRRLLGPSVA